MPPEILEPDLDKVEEGDNARHDFGDDAEELALGNSLLKHQDYPILIRVHPTLAGFFQLVDGHRRTRAARRVGKKKLQAILVDRDLTEAEIQLMMLRTDLHKKKLTDAERVKLLKKSAALHPTLNRKQLAELVEMSAPVVTQLLTEGIPSVEAAFESGLIALASRYELSKGTPEQQEIQLPKALAGATREQLAAHRRSMAQADDPPEPSADTAKLDRLNVAHPDAQVVVRAKGSNGGLNLAASRALLVETIRKIDDAIEAGWSVRTAQKAWLDSSKKKPAAPKPPKMKRAKKAAENPAAAQEG